MTMIARPVGSLYTRPYLALRSRVRGPVLSLSGAEFHLHYGFNECNSNVCE